MAITVTSWSEYDTELPFIQQITFGTGANQATSYTISQTNPSELWVFKQLAVENLNPASASTTVALYLNNVLIAPSNFMTPTPNGIGIAASGLPYLVLQASDQLLVAIAGAATGDIIKIQGIYTQVVAS